MGHPYEDFLRRRVVRKEKTITEQEKYIDALKKWLSGMLMFAPTSITSIYWRLTLS